MVKTDGRPTIAWADLPRRGGKTCAVLNAPGNITKIRLRPDTPDSVVRVIQRKHPNAEVVREHHKNAGALR